jgi:iron complex transport system substrate-binding protein
MISRWLISGLFLASASCAATVYPLTVRDMDNRTVTLSKEPRHVILQDGRDILSLALLDREDPFRRVVAWNNLPKKQDIPTWNLLKSRWPEATKIIDMGFNDQGEVDLESVIARQPDLMIAQLRGKAALQQTGVLDALKKLNIPVVFVDYELHPVENTAKSITLLGTVLNQEARAKEYTDFYRQKRQKIDAVVNRVTQKPTVFIEPIAGNTENCCFTHSHNGWGGLVEAVGGRNIGSELLPGGSGFVSLEKIIAMRPDVYIMTGSKRPNKNVLPFGYGTAPEEVSATFNTLIHRQILQNISPLKKGQAYGVYHHFYNHPWNIIGMEILAKDLYGKRLESVDPTADFHEIVTRFTTLPDEPVLLSYSANR